jgi:hypothetical protein
MSDTTVASADPSTEVLPPDVTPDGPVDRPMRICDVCGQVDNHPRHTLTASLGEIPVNQANLARVLGMTDLTDEVKAAIVADIVDTTTQLRHFDCCTNVGCPDGTCNNHSNALVGAALLADIEAAAVVNNNPLPDWAVDAGHTTWAQAEADTTQGA